MKKTSFYAGIFAVLALHASAAERKPNILLIVADDLGYGELGFQGYTKDIPTPNIDPISTGPHTVEVDVSAEGQVVLKVDGKPAGEGKLSGLFSKQPGEGLSIGSDGKGAVGEYEAPNEISGKATNVTLTLK